MTDDRQYKEKRILAISINESKQKACLWKQPYQGML